ncbi:MAG: hypothetical protein JWR28_3546 [Modestobacter sp.]|nr:hypothetical protein [Modestobacter sp.]
MRLVRVAAVAVAGAAVLAGCSDGGTANETLPSTSTSAAETSESLEPLGPPDFPVPDKAREKTAEGASAFLGYYIALMNRSQTTLSSEGLLDLSLNCDACSTFAEGLDEYKEQGLLLQSGGIRLDGASDPYLKDATAEFSVALTQLPLSVTTPDGSPRLDMSGAEASYPASGALITWDQARSTWVMTELTIQ